jgi:hypothetical protein
VADVIVTGDRGGDSGVGTGIILGILIVIVAIGFAIWYFGLGGNGANHATNINVSPPQINVNLPSAAPAKS